MIEHLIPAWMLIPFAVMLLCIAILPLVPHIGEWWEHNLHKLYVSLILGVPVGIWLCVNGMSHDLIHQMIYDYVPFILLLMALFVTTGGICIRGDLKATPMTNTIILALGWVLASFMGTTGAAMLLIRLLLATIQQRKYRVHTVLFFIAIVANCGGLLSPLGDPPLFLLFQKGASFTWWLQNMVGEWLVTGALLLIIYYVIDWYYYRKEPLENIMADVRESTKMTFAGLINIVWLLCVVLSTMFINAKYIPAMGGDAPWYLKLLVGVHRHHLPVVGNNEEGGACKEQLQLDPYLGGCLCLPWHFRNDDSGLDVPFRTCGNDSGSIEPTVAICLYNRCPFGILG